MHCFANIRRAAIDSIWITIRQPSAADVIRHERKRRIVIVLVWFVTSLLIAIVVPNIGDVISVLGGLAALFAFMFPGKCDRASFKCMRIWSALYADS